MIKLEEIKADLKLHLEHHCLFRGDTVELLRRLEIADKSIEDAITQHECNCRDEHPCKHGPVNRWRKVLEAIRK